MISNIIVIWVVKIYIQHARDVDFPAGFLVGLTNRCIDEWFTGLKVACGLIQDHAPFGMFFDKQKFIIFFNNRGNGEMRSEWLIFAGVGVNDDIPCLQIN